MAHRLLERFPGLSSLLFIDKNRLGDALISAVSPRAVDFRTLFGQIDYFYRNSAADGDIVLYRDARGREVADAFDENVAGMALNTGLKTATGSSVWLRCAKNNIADRSYFFALNLEERYPVEEHGHRLLNRYHSLGELAFINRAYVIQNLQRFCTLPAGIAPEEILAQFNRTYRGLTDAQLRITREGASCAPEDADEICLPTGFTDSTGASVDMVLKPNPREGMQPWVQRDYRICLDGESHRFRRQYPVMIGRERSCLAFLGEGAEGAFQEAMRRTVDNVPNLMVENFVNRVNRIYAEAHDEDIVLYDADNEVVDSLEEARFLRLRTPMLTGKKAVYIQAEKNFPGKSQPFHNPRPISEGEIYPGVRPEDYLSTFANIDLERLIPEIRALALDEPWSFRGEGHFEILRSYLVYSAYRLIQNHQVVIDRTKLLAVMNTGLINRTNNDICMLFSRESASGKWTFNRLLDISEIRRYGFQNAQPSPPRYWDSTSELVYPIFFDKPLETQMPAFNTEHIILERLHRLPREFLKNVAFMLDDATKAEFFGILDSDDRHYDSPAWARAREIVRDTSLYADIRSRIELAIKEALRRQRRNYKTIIPSFFPSANEMCFLMPLKLTSQDALNPALVLSNDGKTYYGRTILTMDMVYKNSRLICKPEADWIRVEDIVYNGDADGED